eukprot:2349569-Ditylum_brightwellii.AAC.1
MGKTGTANTNIDPIIMLENQENTIQSDEAEDTTSNHSNDEGTPTTETQIVFLMGLPASPLELLEGTTTTKYKDAILMSLPAIPPELLDFPDFNITFPVVITNLPMNPPESQQKIQSKQHTDEDHSDPAYEQSEHKHSEDSASEDGKVIKKRTQKEKCHDWGFDVLNIVQHADTAELVPPDGTWIHCEFIHSESRWEQSIDDLFRDQVTQIQEIKGEATITIYVEQLQQQREELKKDIQKDVTEKVKEIMLGYCRSSQVNLQLD